LQSFETRGDFPVAVDGHEVHAVEGHLVGGDLVGEPAGDLDVGDGGRECRRVMAGLARTMTPA